MKFVKDQPKHQETEVEVGSKKKRKKKLRKRRLTKEDRTTAAYADILWVLVSTSEFGTNH